MSAIFLGFLFFLLQLTNTKELDDDCESIYSIFAISYMLSIAASGLIGLAFTFLKLTFIPLNLIYSIFILFTLAKIESKKRLIDYIKKWKTELINIRNLYKNTLYLKVIYALICLIIVASIGPINSHDAINYYVGYPYKFWLRNSLFIDGDMHQGLLGVSDFANIFYFQDHTIWLIRLTKIIPILPITFLILRRKTIKIVSLIILSSPVLIQWLSLGKNHFIGDACLLIIFLIWEKNKKRIDLKYLLSALLIAISFKISALVICFPIFIYLLYSYKEKIFNFKNYKFCFLNWPFLIAVISFFGIAFYRYFLTDNPIHPLFASVISPDNDFLISWEKDLRSYNKESVVDLLWIFVPQSFSKLSFVLGPANLILFIISLFGVFERKEIKINSIIGISQYILLFLFGQPLALYYASPLIVSSIGIKKISLNFLKKYKNLLISFIFFTLFIQIVMFLVGSFYMVFLNIYSIYDYENAMNKFGWNFYNSKILNEKAIPPALNEIYGISHLFYYEDFVPKHRFNKCFYFGDDIDIENKYEYCSNKLGIKTIIVEKNKLRENDKFICEEDLMGYVSRNIFLNSKKEVDICYLRN